MGWIRPPRRMVPSARNGFDEPPRIQGIHQDHMPRPPEARVPVEGLLVSAPFRYQLISATRVHAATRGFPSSVDVAIAALMIARSVIPLVGTFDAAKGSIP
jgi:hypothetical protein